MMFPSRLHCATVIPILSVLGTILGSIQAASLRGGEGGVLGRGLQEDYSASYSMGATWAIEKTFSTLPPNNQDENRIVNGQAVADPADAPFFTMILRRVGSNTKSAGCGASLISNCHALTAAHCVEGNRFGISTDVMVGVYDPFDYDPNGGHAYFVSEIRDIQWHEEYNDFTNRHDVAVITFDTCMTPEELAVVSPVTIAGPDFAYQTGEDVTVYGFGKTSEDQSMPKVGYYTEILRQVTVPLIPYDQCDSMIGSNTVYDDMVCAGGGNQDACQADSGGPAVVMREGEPVQIGVVSWGVGCAREGRPGVYSSVSVHSEWIKSIVCEDVRTNPDLAICGGPGISETTETCASQYHQCELDGPACCTGTCRLVPFSGGTRVCI